MDKQLLYHALLRDEDWSATPSITMTPPEVQSAYLRTMDPKSACASSATVTLSADTFWDMGGLMQLISLPLPRDASNELRVTRVLITVRSG